MSCRSKRKIVSVQNKWVALYKMDFDSRMLYKLKDSDSDILSDLEYMFLQFGAMFSIHKNSYLQSTLKEINPRLLNRCVQRARGFISPDVHDLEPPFNRLVSEHPTIPVQNVDVTRRPVAFGRGAMPKLRRELHGKDVLVVIAALHSISDLCHDPERAIEAINLKVIDRMVDLTTHDEAEVRERTANTLQILARHASGREAIVSNHSLLDNLQICVDDQVPEVRIQVAGLLEMISRNWTTADVLVEFGFIPILLSNLLEELPEIAQIHLETLRALMYGFGKCIALENDGFNIFVKLLDSESVNIITNACECLTLLTSSRLGESLAQKANLLEILNRLLHHEEPKVFTAAASTIMFCTVKTNAKITAHKFEGLAHRLIQISKNKHNPSTQIAAVKALTNICEHPDIRKEVNEKYIQDILDIQLGSEPRLKKYKEDLLTVINWVPTNV